MDTLVAFVGHYLIFVVALVAVVFTLLSEKKVRNRTMGLALLAFPIAMLTAWVAAHLYYHTRPFVVQNVQPLIPHEPNNGFPSDHTLLATVSAAVVFIHSRKVGLLLGIMALLIGVSRVVAKLHYPVDILGGAAIAIASTVIAWVVLKRLAWGVSQHGP